MAIRTIPNEILLEEVDRLIRQGKRVVLTVRGNSMNPFLRDRKDQIVLRPFQDRELQCGKAVLVRTTTGNIVFHRIVKRTGNRLVLMGDGNIQATEEATTEHVIGLLQTVVRNGKKYEADRLVWQLYSFCWTRTRYLRRWILPVLRKLFINQKTL